MISGGCCARLPKSRRCISDGAAFLSLSSWTDMSGGLADLAYLSPGMPVTGRLEGSKHGDVAPRP